MTKLSKQQINSTRAILRPLDVPELNTKLIDCPEHPNAHKAVLYVSPHNYAGTWECPEGLTDIHDHGNLETASYQPWPTSPDENPGVYDIYICSECGVQVEE